jgi:acetoin utilization deacetylase AcuC-like enzyme
VALRTPVVWSERHRLHEPGGAVWVGVRTPGTELPERAERIRAELERAGAPVHEGPLADPDAELAVVHDRALLDYLAAAWSDWEAAGLTEDPGQDRVVPYIFPLAELLPDRPPATPAAVSARAGRFAYDTMTLIGPGTWEAAQAAAATAVTAADLVLGGEPAAYACCRPPGHHATRASFGGSCYLNNAAVAAARLRAKVDRVAVIDVDAHHGNGTQSIFYSNPGVLVGSVHVDPGAGWFPHFLGFADETGAGAGAWTNRNAPVPPGTGDGPWLEAVAGLAEWARTGGAAALVVPLGVDAAGGDPESPLEVTATGFREAGRVLGELRLPTVVVQEGGYDLETIGVLVSEVLTGLEEGAGR